MPVTTIELPVMEFVRKLFSFAGDFELILSWRNLFRAASLLVNFGLSLPLYVGDDACTRERIRLDVATV